MFGDACRRGTENRRDTREVKTDRWIWPVKNLTRGKMTLYAHHLQLQRKRAREKRETSVILTLGKSPPELNDTSAAGLYLLQSCRIKLIVS